MALTLQRKTHLPVQEKIPRMLILTRVITSRVKMCHIFKY